ncbi:MAG: hypothetical protein LDLANPLL_01497 [Turneriella sp.]|nr:hypothetical protein [Turneriella sp.]
MLYLHNKIMRYFVVAVSIVFSLTAQEDKKQVTDKIFSINIEMPENAEYTEIEFSDINLSEASDEDKISGARVNIVRTKEKIFRERLSSEIRFFRVRSIHKTGVAGAYSRTYPVDAYLVKPYRDVTIPVVQQGQTEYLLGSRIELPTQPNLVTKYKIGDGEFIEYREPIIFDKPATYNMLVNLENENKEVVFSKKFIFKVELNAPETRAVIASPIHSSRGIMFGKESTFLFLVTDNESGVDKTFFRVLPLGKEIVPNSNSEYKKRLTYADLCTQEKITLVEFYSTDKAGNKEHPKSQVIFCE